MSVAAQAFLSLTIRIRVHSLFDIYNDLPDNINSTVRLFADDCVLYRNIRGSEDQQILQDDLNKLAQWEEAWLMKFNIAKCHSLERLRNRTSTCSSTCSSISRFSSRRNY